MTAGNLAANEIALIKAMLKRGMRNRDIQFYFNRQDRPVNSGRITEIKNGSKHTSLRCAEDQELDKFLSEFNSVSSTAPPGVMTIEDRARALFERSGAEWFLRKHETDDAECKESFCLKPEHRFVDPLRSIAGLSNNRGGFVFFGVKEDKEGKLKVTGLGDGAFAATDPADINRCLASALDPIPVFQKFILDLEGMSVGVIYVEKHDHAPVVALKNINNEFKEGSIYYRYVGETRAIKPGELRQVISAREQRAVAHFASQMTQIASGAAATLNLDTGKVEGKTGSFVIGEDLLPKL